MPLRVLGDDQPITTLVLAMEVQPLETGRLAQDGVLYVEVSRLCEPPRCIKKEDGHNLFHFVLIMYAW